MDKEKPQYYGIWITPEGINSIFFMNINWINSGDNRFGGTIDDRLGEAKFNGVKTEESIDFMKEYQGKPHPLASKFTLEYKGTPMNNFKNFYEGVYITKDEEGNPLSGTFILQPFPQHSNTMNSLLREFYKKCDFR